MIKGVYFDWGGVLIENPSLSLLEYISAYFKIDKKDMRKKFDENSEIMDDYQKGLIQEEEIWQKILNRKNEKVWSNAVKNSFKINKVMVDFACELKKRGYKIGVLSNTEKEAVENFEMFFDSSIFEYRIFSCDEFCAKPNKKIYENAIKLMDLPPHEILFIDDRKDFIIGAQEIGLKTFHFKDFSCMDDFIKIFEK